MKKKTVSGNRLTRQSTATARAIDAPSDAGAGAQQRYSVRVSSTTPCMRYGWLADEWQEVLSHDPGAVNLERADGLPFLLDHDPSQQIGVIETLSLSPDDGAMDAEVRFSRNAQAIENDVADGIRRNVSVGYRVDEYTRTGSTPEGVPIFTATKWTPLEVSSVAVPADFTAQFQRDAGAEGSVTVVDEGDEEDEEGEEAQVAAAAAETAAAVADATSQAADAAGSAQAAAAAAVDAANAIAQDAAADDEDGEDDETENSGESDTDTARTAAPGAEAPASNPTEAQRAAETAATAERHAVEREITQMATAAGVAERAADFIARKLTVDEVGKEILALRRSASTVAIHTPEKDSPKMKYNIARAIQVALGLERGGLEAELDAKIAQAMPDTYQRHGARSIFVPVSAAQVRALSTNGGAGNGQETVFTEKGDFIELLRNRSVVFELGARSYTNLRGPVQFPRQVGAAQAHWVSENAGADVEDSQALFQSVTLAPKTLQSNTAISRQLLTQSAFDIESIILDDLTTVHALAIDRAALHGMGGAEPLGVYNAPGVANVDMSGGIGFGKVVDMVTEVAAGNALLGNQAFVATPRIAGKMAQTLVAQAAGAGFIWNGKLNDGTMAGYTAIATNQMRSDMGAGNNEHGLVFGNFSDIMVGTWGILELVIDEYSLKKQGLIEITTFQMADVALRHGASFAKATGLTLAA